MQVSDEEVKKVPQIGNSPTMLSVKVRPGSEHKPRCRLAPHVPCTLFRGCNLAALLQRCTFTSQRCTVTSHLNSAPLDFGKREL